MKAKTVHHEPSTPDLELTEMSFSSLLEMKRKVDDEIQARQTQEIEQLREKVMQTTQSLGISVAELFGLHDKRRKRGPNKSQGPLPPKYRGPSGEEWSGKGPPPKWMKPHLANGKTKDDFLIK